jgi:hypothetical protein
LITILLLPTYLNLSVSVMVGLPALAFAMLRCLPDHLAPTTQLIWLTLSAIALSLSVLTKLFTGFRPQSSWWGLCWTKSPRQPASACLAGVETACDLGWGFSGVTAAAVLVLVGPGNLDQRSNHI